MRPVILILVTIIWTLGGFLFSILYPGCTWIEGLTFSMFLWFAVIASAVTKPTSVGVILLITANLIAVAAQLEEVPQLTTRNILAPMLVGSLLGVITQAGSTAVPVPQAKTTSAS